MLEEGIVVKSVKLNAFPEKIAGVYVNTKLVGAVRFHPTKRKYQTQSGQFFDSRQDAINAILKSNGINYKNVNILYNISDIAECTQKSLSDILLELDERCWDGYKPVPGKDPYEKGSCTKESSDDTIDLDEVSPPGTDYETWIKKNKARFIKQYGAEKGKQVLYARAWKMKNQYKTYEK